jgi:uncharacterized protein YraI
MNRYFTPIAAGCFALVAAPAAALAQDAIVTIDLNMRAGPSTAFPVVDVVPGRTPVDVHGCVAGYSWCDVSTVGNRGWVYAGYLSYAARGSYVPLVEYVTEIDVPIISFSVGSYWDSYYRNRPGYGQRTQWRDRWQANWRDIRRDRRDNRVERRIDRREDRRDDRRGVRVERRTDQREAAQERRSERRVNRVERRRDRPDGRVQRPRGEQRQMQRQERSAPRSGDRGERGERGGRRGRDG